MSFVRNKPVFIAHKLFEAVVGGSDRPPIIFMHGMMECKEIWKSIPQRVADETKRKVYTYDARNHGESEHTMDSKLDNNVYDLYHFMDKMKIDKSILVGSNMGAITAILACIQQPLRIETAFIVDMHVGRIPKEFVREYILYMRSCAVKLHHTPADVPRPNLARVQFPPPLEKLSDEGLFRSVLTFRLLALMDALIQYDKSSRIPSRGQFSRPAYFIYSSKSPFRVQDHKNEILSMFPSAQMIKFEGATANPHLEHPDEFVKILCERISRRIRS